MKKLLLLLLSLTLSVGALAACGSGADDKSSSKTSESASSGSVDENSSIVIEPNSYTVTFNLNDGTTTPKTEEVTVGESYSFTDPTKTGHKFLGWSDGASEGYFAKSGTWTKEGDLSLTAVWEALTYTVTFDVNGGNALANAQQTVTYGVAPESFATPERASHTFDGWTYDGKLVDATAAWAFASDVTLVASWTEIIPEKYNVTFKQNGQEIAVKTVEEGDTLTDIPSVVPVTGHNVVWNRTDFSNITDHIVVEAIVTPKNYTVTLNANGGQCDKTSVSVTYASAYELPVPTKTGYTFKGWKGTSVLPQTGEWDIDQENLLLTAQWEAATYTVTLDAGNGKVGGAKTLTVKVTYGQVPTVIIDATWGDEASFLGWKYNGETLDLTKPWDIVVGEEGLTLTAIWYRNWTPNY